MSTTPAAGRAVLCLSMSVMVMLGTWALPAYADKDSSTLNELKGLSVAQLLSVKVTSVARHPEKLLATASAIQVITADDIRRSGATTLAEALRLADNLQVAQKNSHDWAISARGFNTALANKLLVMIDGRTVYTPLFSGVFWDLQDYLLEDIDRIEVISGPGGALWGANAVNGIINIITKSAADTKGAYVEAGGGSEPEQLAAARYGASLSSSTSIRVYGKYLDRGDEVLSDGAPSEDSWHQERGGFRLDSNPSSRDALSVHGDLYSGDENEPTGRVAVTSGGNLMGRWSRVFSADSDMSLQTYIDQTQLMDPIPAFALGAIRLTPAGYLHDTLTTYDVDFQHRLPIGLNQSITWGLGYRHTEDQVMNAPALEFLPTTLDQNLFSGFAQDEIQLAPSLSYTLGTKLEHNDYTGWELEPSTRLNWVLHDNQAVWAAISRAVRTPSRVDRDELEGAPPLLVLLKGSPDFESEHLVAYEIGYRAQIASRFSGSVSTFDNDYTDLRSTSYTPGTVLPFYFANYLEGHTYGAELTGDYQVLDNWSLHAGYTVLSEHLHVKPGQVDINDGLNETADPSHQYSLRSSLNLPRQVQWDAALRWIDTLPINSGPTLGTVPSYLELNSRLAWQPTQHLELSVTGENLLHNRHAEYGFPGPDRVEIERSVYAKLVWRQ
jgi:iron complex outermembrane recepter protein